MLCLVAWFVVVQILMTICCCIEAVNLVIVILIWLRTSSKDESGHGERRPSICRVRTTMIIAITTSGWLRLHLLICVNTGSQPAGIPALRNFRFSGGTWDHMIGTLKLLECSLFCRYSWHNFNRGLAEPRTKWYTDAKSHIVQRRQYSWYTLTMTHIIWNASFEVWQLQEIDSLT